LNTFQRAEAVFTLYQKFYKTNIVFPYNLSQNTVNFSLMMTVSNIYDGTFSEDVLVLHKVMIKYFIHTSIEKVLPIRI